MNFPVARCCPHGRCCCPPPELLFVLPGSQLFPSFPPLLPVRLPFLFALLFPRPFSCPPPLLFFQLWCWICIYCFGWNGIWYVTSGTQLVMAWYIICACFSCCCNCVLVAVNPDIVFWLLLNADEKPCTKCSYAASASVVAVSVVLPPKPYFPDCASAFKVHLFVPKNSCFGPWFFCLALHAIFQRM